MNTTHELSDNRVYLYTDGACKGNPGPGGWGVLMRYREHEHTLSGGEKLTTNNRMELMAAIEGLRALKRKSAVVITTDSTYVKNGVEQWMANWKRKQWRTANKQPVKNVDLWQQLDALLGEHDVQWQWVKGHSGHDGNERADALANQGVQAYLGHLY